MGNLCIAEKLEELEISRADVINHQKDISITHNQITCRNMSKQVQLIRDKIHSDQRMCKRQRSSQIPEMNRFLEYLKQVDHPYIVKILEIYESKDDCYLIMNSCRQNLVEYYNEKKSEINEDKVKMVARQLLYSLNQLHGLNLIHRKIILDKILINAKGGHFAVKLLLSNNIVNNNDFVSTYTNFYNPIEFCAPELFEQDIKNGHTISSKVDIFSLGVVLFFLACGSLPFAADTKEEQIEKIKQNQSEVDTSQLQLSPEGKEFIMKMLEPMPEERPTAKQCLTDPWLKQVEGTREFLFEGRDQDFKLSEKSMQTLKMVLPNMRHQAHFDQLCRILSILNLAITDNDNKHLEIKELFIELDYKKEGRLNVNFLKRILMNIEPEASSAIAKLNTATKNQIEQNEWLSACCDKRKIFTDKNLRRVFDIIDQDKSGNISQQEIKDFLKGDKNYDEKVFNEVMKRLDESGDNEIEYEEFKNFVIRSIFIDGDEEEK